MPVVMVLLNPVVIDLVVLVVEQQAVFHLIQVGVPYQDQEHKQNLLHTTLLAVILV